MIARLFLALIAFSCIYASTPGLPLILEVPLNRTAFPNGLSSNTTKAPTYRDVPVDQYAFMVPLNALRATVSVTFPDDDNNGYLDYDVSTMGPLCQYQYQLNSNGYVCGGSDSYQYFSTGTSHNITFSSSDMPGSAVHWAVGTYFYFGFTADSDDDNVDTSPLAYTINEIYIETCPTGTIGGENAAGDSACLPVVQVPSNFSGSFNYPAGNDYIFFQVDVPANTGYVQATLTFPAASVASGLTTYMYGAPMGAPGEWYECGDSSGHTTVGNDEVVTWTCEAPSAGRYYVSFRNSDSDTGALTGTYAFNFTTCSGMTAGSKCEETFLNYGNVIAAANNVSTFNFTTTGSEVQLRINIPQGTVFPLNVTFAANGSVSYIQKANSYATDANNNDNYEGSVSSGSTFTYVFQSQTTFVGQAAYFLVDPSSSGTVNHYVTLSTSASPLPSSSTTMGSSGTGMSSSSSGSRSSSSSSRSGSSSSSSTRSGSSSSSTSATRTATESPSAASALLASGVVAILAFFF